MQVPATFGFRDPLSAHDAALVNVTCRARFLPDIAGMHTPGLLAGGAGSTHAEFSEGYSGNATLFVKAGLAGQIEVTVWGDYAYLRPTEGDNPANLIPSPLPGDGPGPGDLPNINSGGGIPKMVTGQIRFGATIGFGVGPYGQTFFSDMSLQNDDRDDISGRILSLAPRPLPLGATLTFSPRFTYSGPGQAMDMQPITYLLIIRVTDVKTQPRPPRPSPPPTPQPRPVPAPLVPTLLMQKVYFLFNQSDHLDRANNNTGNFPNKVDQLLALQNFMDQIVFQYGAAKIRDVGVHGYASAPGTREYNFDLSRARAYNIADFIRSMYHSQIPDDRITPHGEPKFSHSEKDNPEDRRVDVWVTVY